jgi:hypothetical protein
MFLDLQLPEAPGDQVNKTAKQIDPEPQRCTFFHG